MICLVCQTDNKDAAKVCRKCGVDLATAPLWKPSWAWHGKVLGAIYVVLIIAYFAITAFVTRLPEPYKMRKAPEELTPWIKNG